MFLLKTLLELVLCLYLAVLSSLVSAAEVGIFTLSRIQLRFLKENFRSAYIKIRILLSDPGGTLVSILVLNECINVILSTFITELLSLCGFEWTWVPLPTWIARMLMSTLITAPLVLFICEISPKVLAAKMNRLVAPLTVRFLFRLYEWFLPVRWIFYFTLEKFKVRHRLAAHQYDLVVKESDLLLMLEQAQKEGSIDFAESELIRKVFLLDDLTVAGIAHPLEADGSLLENQSLQDAFCLMKSKKMSRIPILSQSRKEVLGVLYIKDLLKVQLNHSSESLLMLMRKPFFVQPHMTLNALFRQFKAYKTHIAIVKDTKGHLYGYVTMQDILDSLFKVLFTEGQVFSTKFNA